MIESNLSKEVKLKHPLAQSLLKEFEDMFPNDLPLRLLALKGIELGIPFPSKPAYGCNPSESKE